MSRGQAIAPAALGAVLPGVLMIGLTLWLFLDTAQAMVAIWRRSDTFAHAFLVAPISAWLIWRRRGHLTALPRRTEPLALVAAAAVCLLWLLGELAAVRAATQFALVALVVLSVPALFGRHVARALAFPLLFLFFAVPIGEFMVEPMIAWTADFTVFALRATGIPVYREGMQFVIPSGNWSVVDACSGVRYLIASFMVGTLFAYMNFRSPLRRAAFIAVSLVVPIVANWVRAYLIVLVGHLSSNRLAAGVDHLIYGWVFFGVVMAAMFAIGARWSQPDVPVADVPRLELQPTRPGALRWWAAGAAMVGMMLSARGYAELLLNQPPPLLAAIAVPAAPAGWVTTKRVTDWVPAYRGPRVSAGAGYRSGSRQVDTWVGYYAGQNEEHKLVTSGNQLVAGGEADVDGWRVVARSVARESVDGGSVVFRAATLRGSPAPGAHGAPWLRVWQVYWIGGRFVASDAEATLRIALRRLIGQGDGAAVIFFSTELGVDSPAGVAEADAVLADLARLQTGAVGRALERL